MFGFMLDNLEAVLGTDPASPDVWVTRIGLFTVLVPILAAAIVSVIRAGKTNDKVDANASALSDRLDKYEATNDSRHDANTAHLTAIESKLDAHMGAGDK